MVVQKGKASVGKYGNWLVNGLSIYWILFIFLDFIGNSPDYLFALGNNQYFDYLFITSALCLVISLPFIKKPISLSEVRVVNFRWVYLYPLLLVCMLMFTFFYQSKTGNSAPTPGFLINTLGIHFFIFWFFLSVYSSGSFILKRISSYDFEGFRDFIIIGLGIIVLALLLFFAGLFGLYSKWPIISILVVMLIPGWKNLLHFLSELILKKQGELKLHPFSILMLLAVIVLTAVNFISISTAFPLGFDSLTLYLNLPMLISQSGELIEGHMPYYWSLVMGIGYAVFESNSIVQHLGIIGGLLSFLLIVKLGSRILTINWAIFSGAFFYFIPLVIWQSSTEVKTDLGLLFFTLLSVSIIFYFYHKFLKERSLSELRNSPVGREELMVWFLVGLFSSFALGIKFTAVMSMIAIAAAFLYLRSGFWLSLTGALTAIAFLFLLELYSFGGILISSNEKWLLVAVFLFLAIITFLLSLRKKQPLKPLIQPVAIFLFSSLILLLPWMGKNISEHGSISFSKLIEGNTPGPQWLSYDDGETFPNDQFLPMFMSHTIEDDIPIVSAKLVNVGEEIVFTNTSRIEEIGRYLGYEGGAMRFLSLPYDLTMKKNVDLLSTDIGVLFLLFFPLLIFLGRGLKAKSWVFGWVLICLWISLSIWSVYNPDNSLNVSEIVSQLEKRDYAAGSGLFSTFKDLHLLLIYPFLLLGYLFSPVYEVLTMGGDFIGLILAAFVFSIFYPIFINCWRGLDSIARMMAIFGLVYFAVWLFFASGIPWYGLTGLAILPMFLAKFYFSNERSPANYSSTIRYFSIGMVAFWLILILALRFSPHASNKIPIIDNVDYTRILAEPTMAYASGKLTDEEFFLELFNPETELIINELNSGEDGYIINVASMMRFFIEDNHLRVFDDSQLDFFNTTWEAAGKSKVATSNRLKNHGVRYILLDLDVHTLDRTPDGSLRRKVEELVEFLHNNRHIELVATDRLVEHPAGNAQMEHNGRLIRVRNDIFGTQIIEQGKLALFKLK